MSKNDGVQVEQAKPAPDPAAVATSGTLAPPASVEEENAKQRPDYYEIPEPLVRLLMDAQAALAAASDQAESIALELEQARRLAQEAEERLYSTLAAAAEIIDAPSDYTCVNAYAGFTAPHVEPEQIAKIAQQNRQRQEETKARAAAERILGRIVTPNGSGPHA